MSTILSDKLVQAVKGAIQREEQSFLRKLIDDTRPADLADLIEHLDPLERLYVFTLLEPEGAGEVLVEMESPIQEGIISELDDEAISEIVQELDSDDAADLVGGSPGRKGQADHRKTGRRHIRRA